MGGNGRREGVKSGGAEREGGEERRGGREGGMEGGSEKWRGRGGEGRGIQAAAILI